MEKTKEEKEQLRITYTIILNKLLPRRDEMNKRYFVDGKWLSTYRINQLLTKAGYIVTSKEVAKSCLANEYKGIKLTSSNGGLMVCPKNPEDYQRLSDILRKDDYWYHGCYYPNVKHKDYKWKKE